MKGSPLGFFGALLAFAGMLRLDEAFGPHGTLLLKAISVALTVVGLVLIAAEILERPRR